MEESQSNANLGDLPGRIRKRRFSTARIQPTRIKKVMQSDEEIGRMIASVPVAVGSAMEHFAERLLETAANVMHGTLSKTLSPQHIQQAIRQTPSFSFLSNVISISEDANQQAHAAAAQAKLPPSFSNVMNPSTAFGYPVSMSNGMDYGCPVSGPSISEYMVPIPRIAAADPEDIPGLMRARAHNHLADNAAKADNARQRRPRVIPAPVQPVKPKLVETLPLLDEFGMPVKRKRGRPRKDEQEKIQAARAAAAVAAASTTSNCFQNNVPKEITTSPSKPPPRPADLPSAPSNVVNGVDRDRELMPPPMLPMRMTSSTATTTSSNSISSPQLVVSSQQQQSSSADPISA